MPKHISENTELMKEWDWKDNRKEGLDPTQLTCGSNKRANWICRKGHKWKSAIHGRSREGYGCPYCANEKIWPGYNDLATTHPELLKDWDYQKNTLKPTEVAARSNKKAWWKCSQGHSYESAIAKKTEGQSCPYCSNKKVLVGYNELATTHPDIASEWNYPRNNPLSPSMFYSKSNRTVWWKCSQGHEWKATIDSRVRGTGCPYCAGNILVKGINACDCYGVLKVFMHESVYFF